MWEFGHGGVEGVSRGVERYPDGETDASVSLQSCQGVF